MILDVVKILVIIILSFIASTIALQILWVVISILEYGLKLFTCKISHNPGNQTNPKFIFPVLPIYPVSQFNNIYNTLKSCKVSSQFLIHTPIWKHSIGCPMQKDQRKRGNKNNQGCLKNIGMTPFHAHTISHENIENNQKRTLPL
jgi:hypothetical protein